MSVYKIPQISLKLINPIVYLLLSRTSVVFIGLKPYKLSLSAYFTYIGILAGTTCNISL